MTVGQFVTISISILAVLNPIGTAAIYISLMGNRSAAELKAITVRFTIAILIITAISEWIGHYFLTLFGINLPSFDVAGGIILGMIGLGLILPKGNSDQVHKSLKPSDSSSGAPHQDIAIVPLAVPIGAGPGVIALIIASAERMHGHFADKLIFAAILVVLCFIMWLTMRFAPVLKQKLSTLTLSTMSRIMGLIITAIGMKMLADGMLGLFPGLH